jgi:hypothetical protein
MPFMILIPMILSAVALCVWPPGWVFRNLTLPVLLLLPVYYSWKLPLLPPLDFGVAALLPLGVVMCLRSLSLWRFSILDLWLGLFVLSTGMADRLLGQNTPSAFELFDNVNSVLIPYMAGKLLIEQEGARAATLKRIVLLMAGAAVPSLYEWKFLKNPFQMVFGRFFPHEILPWYTHLRGGHGRICGPYAQAEFAGMMLVFGLVLTLHLAQAYNWGGRFRSAAWFPARKSTLVFLVLLLALFCTGSRGPAIGFLVATPIALIGRSRNPLRNAVLVALLLTVGGAITYEGLVHYAGTRTPTTEEQETAAYRLTLVQDYLPMAEHGGFWGRGLSFPRIGKYGSVDNEYLWVALTQGYIGFASLVLLVAGTLYNLGWAAVYNSQPSDRAFAFTLLGIFIGLLVTVSTVYLGIQPLMFFSLLIGWAQALREHRASQPQLVFAQVYT